MAESCPFCAIVDGRAPAKVVAEWPETIAIVPHGPVVEGHTLIIPREHVAKATSSRHVAAETMYRAAEFARRFESSNIIVSSGAPATQSVFHLHIHVVPRAFGDQLMVPWGTLDGENPQDPHRCKGMVALEDRLQRIAEAHEKDVDSVGGTTGLCAECDLAWPCPTYVWATTPRDPNLAPWDPDEDKLAAAEIADLRQGGER
jgi:histidine triad (HIT) family protein